jgi:hypothetical protein
MVGSFSVASCDAGVWFCFIFGVVVDAQAFACTSVDLTLCFCYRISTFTFIMAPADGT